MDNSAALEEKEFVEGWIKLSQEENHGEYLLKIKKIVGEDNCLL